MSILTFPTSARSGASRGPRAPAPNLVSSALSTIVSEWRLWKANRAMQSLSDDMLHDIGVTRSDIDHATRHGRPIRF